MRAKSRPTPKDFTARALTMLKFGANILHFCGCCSAPLNGFSVKPKRVYYSLYRFSSIVGTLPVLSLPSVFGERLGVRLIILHHHFPA